jgi:hypothetical protein
VEILVDPHPPVLPQSPEVPGSCANFVMCYG